MRSVTFQDFEFAFAAAPDIAPDFSNADAANSKTTFPARDEQELRATLSQLAYYNNSFNIPPKVMKDIDLQVVHEVEHGEAISLAGAVSLGMGVKIFNNPETGAPLFLPYHKFSQAPSKLARAAINLYPSILNQTDINAAAAIGFESVEKLARAAERHNGEHGTTLPIPRSLNPKARVHIPLANPSKVRG